MRATPPQRTFADLEFLHQGVHLDPTLQAISDLLDQHGETVELVRQDLQRGLQKPLTGRGGINASQALRSLILMRVKNWDYRELRERINDGYTLRHFTDFDSQPVPQHDAFHRAFLRLTPQTLQAINGAVVQAAVQPWGSRTAASSASIPRSWKPISITPPMPPCCGTVCG